MTTWSRFQGQKRLSCASPAFSITLPQTLLQTQAENCLARFFLRAGMSFVDDCTMLIDTLACRYDTFLCHTAHGMSERLHLDFP